MSRLIRALGEVSPGPGAWGPQELCALTRPAHCLLSGSPPARVDLGGILPSSPAPCLPPKARSAWLGTLKTNFVERRRALCSAAGDVTGALPDLGSRYPQFLHLENGAFLVSSSLLPRDGYLVVGLGQG